jgi:pyrimidine operon attenuation protein/uracil phosphoribosyltransferase
MPLASETVSVAKSKTIGPAEIHAALDRMAAAISARHGADAKLLLLGIANGGITVARRLAGLLKHPRTGTLDISFHRDDIGRNPIPKEFSPTVLPVDVNHATVILVDDVLFSGRTLKAALDELFDHGRPAKVELAVLVDRGGRRLPVAADYTGLTISAGDGEKVIVHIHEKDPLLDRIEIAAKTNR